MAHSSAVDILVDVSLDIGPGRYGLVGANGVGKSTLLDLVEARVPPTGGHVDLVCSGPIVRVRQDPTDLTPRIRSLAADWDAHAVAHRRRFDLDVDEVWGWDLLSPGRRMQWHVATALAAEPDLLLLDEPSNHLDATARERLVAGLVAAATPLMVVVSHDRALLDAVTTSTLRMVDGGVESWAGSWTTARQRWVAAARAARADHDRARRGARRARRQLADNRRALRGIERGAAASRRAAGTGDPDARGALAKAHAADAASSMSSRVAASRSAVDRAEHAVDDTSVRRRRGGPVRVPADVSGRDLVAHLVADAVMAGDHEVAGPVDLAVGPDDRIRIAGANGSGKSTLVHALVATAAVDDVGVLVQEAHVDPARRDELLATPDRHRILAIVDHLGVDPDRLSTTDKLSPGEVRKLLLADIIVRPRPLVVLDEPTNHLDIEAIERLQQALVDYDGALVVVTHDQALAAAVTSTTWHLADGQVSASVGVGARMQGR